MKKIWLVPGAVLALLVSAGGYYLSPAVTAASGFAAKNICSGHFLSGLSPQQVIDEALSPASRFLASTRFDIDEHGKSVDAALWGLFTRRAVYVKGQGCVLLAPGDATLDWPDLEPTVAPPQHGTDKPSDPSSIVLDRRLDTVLQGAFEEIDPAHKRNTKAVVVMHRGKLVAERYAAGIDAGTPLLGWSMTKSVTGLLVGILVGEGRLQLDQPAPVPAWREQPGDPRAAITLDQLLRMSSGLEFEETYGVYSDVSRMLSLEKDAAGYAASKPLAAQPGSHWAYASGTSNILAGIIRRTVGGDRRKYRQFPIERLFRPLGIHTAIMETDANGTSIGSSYMYASARDWARLGQLCLQNGRWQGRQVLPEYWMAYSTTPTPNNPQRNYGAHFWLNADPVGEDQHRTWPSLPADTYSMNGFQGQRVVIVPSMELVVARLGFSGGKKRGIEQLVTGVIEVLVEQ